MKKTLTTVVMLLVITFCLKAQFTTEEEYNWMTKGYEVMISSGLDMKKGYYFDDTQEESYYGKNYTCTYKFLRRDKDKSLAGIIIVVKPNSTSMTTRYYGLPIGEWNPPSKIGDMEMPAYYLESQFMSKFLASLPTGDSSVGVDFYKSFWSLFAKISMMYLPKTVTPGK